MSVAKIFHTHSRLFVALKYFRKSTTDKDGADRRMEF